MAAVLKGKIVKGIGGFYYILAEDGNTYSARARGLFRKDKIKPLPGDNVKIQITDPDALEGSVEEILPRKNYLIRPEIANADQTAIIIAIKDPKPNTVILDKLLVSIESKGLDPVVCFNKTDLADAEEIKKMQEMYSGAGCRLIFISAVSGEGLDELREILTGKTTVFMGNSGVGKSTIVNILYPEAEMETGDINDKLKRGRHTTRHSELFCVSDGTYIIDTPGFSAFELAEPEESQLKYYYKEFEDLNRLCRFNDCVHMDETGCAVKSAVCEGKIDKNRYDNYREIFKELKSGRKY